MMRSLRNLNIKTSACKRISKELHSYEKEVEREAAKTADMKDKGADPCDIKQQESVLAESRMMIPDCQKRLEVSLVDLRGALAKLEESDQMKGPEIEDARSTIAELAYRGSASFVDLLNTAYSGRNGIQDWYGSSVPISFRIQTGHGEIEGKLPISSRKKQRAKNFSIQEDLMLVSARLNTSIEAVHGTEQRCRTYWERVHSYFHENKRFHSHRNANSLMHRWSVIQIAVSKFHAYFKQIEAQQQSDVEEQDKICQAMEMYRRLEKTSFVFLHCWNELRNSPKWSMDGSKKKPKTSKKSSPATSPPTPDVISLSEDDVVKDTERAQTSKPAAEEQSEKGKSVLFPSVIPVAGENTRRIFEEFKEEPKLKLLTGEERFEKIYAQEREKIQQQQELICLEKAKEQREQQLYEQKILATDTANMDEDQKLYYSALKKHIIQKRLNGGFDL